MAKKLSQIRDEWSIIKNETIEYANTASRVGSAGVDIVEYIDTLEKNISTPVKRYKDEVATETILKALPAELNEVGDGRIVTEDVNAEGQSYVWVWDGDSWSRTPYTTLPADVLTATKLEQATGYQKKNTMSQKAISVEFDSLVGKNLLNEFDSVVAGDWLEGFGGLQPSNNMAFTAGQSQAIKLLGVFVVGETYNIKLKAYTDTVANIMHVGSTITSLIPNPNAEKTTTLTNTVKEYNIEIIASTTDLWVGMPAGKNKGGIISIDKIEVYKKSWVYENLDTSVKEIESINNMLTGNNILSESDSILSEGNKWESNLGGLIPSNELNFTAGINQSIKLPNVFTIGESYSIIFKAKADIDGHKLHIGANFSSNISGKEDEKEVLLSNVMTEYSFNIKANRVDLWIGSIAAKNKGGIVTVEKIEVQKASPVIAKLNERLDKLESINVRKTLNECYTSFNRDSKYLVKFCCAGDSLTANNIGGNIPANVDEGGNMRPMRLLTNNFPRRLYDLLSWNKPTWRRVGHADWINNGFTSFSENGLFEGTQEAYYKATQSGAYLEITVPQGVEHFGLLCRQKNGYGKLNVTLNGGSVGSYDNPYYIAKVSTNNTVNESIVPRTIARGKSVIDLNVGVSTTGNPYHIEQYNNLPTGQSNVLRFTADSVTRVDIWGGFYWSGNTLVIMNIAHGGHTTTDLINQHLQDELFNEDYDAILFEVTEMNNLRLSLDQTESDLRYIVNKLKGKDVCFTSCNPLGLSIEHDRNFYTEYLNPTQEQVNDRVREVLNTLGVPFLDIFESFRQLTENRGGTLEGGEAGLWYTWDGQHGNKAGCKVWYDMLVKLFKDKPIMQ